MKLKEAKQIIESEFGDLRKEDRSQYDTLVPLLVKYGADESRPLDGRVSGKLADVDRIIEYAFKLGEQWGATYGGWFTPTEDKEFEMITDGILKTKNEFDIK